MTLVTLLLLVAPALAQEGPGDLVANPPVPACKDIDGAEDLGVLPPLPPADYDVPVHRAVVSVSDTAGLVAAVASSTPKDIVLATGVYKTAGLTEPLALVPGQAFLKLNAAHRLWAEEPLGAILRFGIDAGGNGSRFVGPELHGLVVLIDDATNAAMAKNEPTAPTIGVSLWGDASDAVLHDLLIVGNGVVERGLTANQRHAAEDLEVRRVIIDDFSRYGVHVDHDDGNTSAPASLRDLVVTHVGEVTPEQAGSSETAHIGIWMGASGDVQRVRVRDVSRVGVVSLGTMTDGLLRDLDVDRIGLGSGVAETWTGIGLYIDNTTIDTTWERFCVGPNTRFGLISEWDNCSEGGDPAACFPRGIGNTLTEGIVESHFIGMNLDQGTEDTEVSHVTFRNASKTGLVMWGNVGSTEHDNTFDLPVGACDVSTLPWNAAIPCPP